MPLEEYKKKRRFAVTPEPSPRVKGEPGRAFVIQKHQASPGTCGSRTRAC
jgi:hypothetical protein